MTDQEKRTFLQTKKEKIKSSEDLDLTSSKILPPPKQLQTLISLPEHYIGDILVIYTFITSCQSLLNNDLSKTTQQFLRTFKLDYFLNTTSDLFSNYFLELLQILIKLLLKEDDNHDENDDDEEQQHENQVNEQIQIDEDIEQIYDMKLLDIPLTNFTCQELTRLYLLKEKNLLNRNLLEKLTHSESKDFLISEQIDLLLLLINLISTNNEIMSEYFEYLTRTMSETYRERNQLLAERRKCQEEESKQKKLQLQNGEKSTNKNSSLLTPKNSSGIINDENHQVSSEDNESGNDEDLKTVIQRRRQMTAISKELKEKREIEAQKLHTEHKRELAIQKAEQAYQEALINLQYGFRIKPLGFDRNYNRYWFFKGHPGLFVEKGWIGSDITYSTQNLSSPSRSVGIFNGEKFLPKNENNQWWIYDNELIIEQLVQSLNNRGIREENLLGNIKKILPNLQNEFEQIKKEKISTEEILENNFDIILSFKNDLEDIENRLRQGSLGGFIINENLLEWQTKLKQSTERIDLAEVLIQLQQTVAEKFASGIFGTHENRSKNTKNSSKKSKKPLSSSPLTLNKIYKFGLMIVEVVKPSHVYMF